MPKGLKQTSSPIQISTASSIQNDPIAAQFTSKRIDLQLNPLDNEVFVVTGLKIDFENPVALVNSVTPAEFRVDQKLSVSTGPQTAYAGISSPQVIGASAVDGQCSVQAGPTFDYYIVNEQNAMDAPPASMEYLHIIATNDFFINHLVSENYAAGQTMACNVRLYGYRAVADASTYAALVQSELLSS